VPDCDYDLWQEEDLILHCHFQSKAAKDEIVGIHGERLKIRITAPLIDGKANALFIKLCSKNFKVPKCDLEILHGELGRQKTLRFRAPMVLPEYIAQA
jgi:uncharacterized protein (TIGR00251 family)